MNNEEESYLELEYLVFETRKQLAILSSEVVRQAHRIKVLEQEIDILNANAGSVGKVHQWQ